VGKQKNIILQVKNLKVSFCSKKGEIQVIDDVSFEVYSGQILGIVGESGSGKTLTSLAIMRLLNESSTKISSGEIWYQGENLLQLSSKKMCAIRGNKISMIFQESMNALNPVFTIGSQIAEVIQLHYNLSKKEIRHQVIEMLKIVGISSPEKRIDHYPHQLSGGMRQRVMIAMAIACRPQLLIADEPTTALDVTIQAQILELLKKLQEWTKMAVILITHDLGVIAELADQVAVMYAGQIVEYAGVKEIFDYPRMPYTQELLKSIPHLQCNFSKKLHKPRLNTIPGIVPDFYNLPQGCYFQARCPHQIQLCKKENPFLRKIKPKSDFNSHWIRCIRDIEIN